MKDNIFRAQDGVAIFTNNNDECMEKRLEGGVLFSTYYNLASHIRGLDKDLISLDR